MTSVNLCVKYSKPMYAKLEPMLHGHYLAHVSQKKIGNQEWILNVSVCDFDVPAVVKYLTQQDNFISFEEISNSKE